MGHKINEKKNLFIALTCIYGIGQSVAHKICAALGIDAIRRAGDLSPQEINSINNYIRDNLKVEDELRKEVYTSIKTLAEMNCYRGVRLKRKLPARGQRTKCNAKTAKKISRI